MTIKDVIRKFDFSLSEPERKVFSFILAKVRENSEVLNFNISDLRNVIKADAASADEYIKRLLCSLKSKLIFVTSEDSDIVVSLIDKIKMCNKDGTIELTFSDEIMPYFICLKESDESLVDNVFKLQGQYAKNLYILLKSNDIRVEKTIELSELMYKLDALNKSYANYGTFKNKVLKPAIAEIISETDIIVVWFEKKKGKKVTHIKFSAVTRNGLIEEMSEYPEKKEKKKNDNQISIIDNDIVKRQLYVVSVSDMLSEFNYSLTDAEIEELCTITRKMLGEKIPLSDNKEDITDYIKSQVLYMRSVYSRKNEEIQSVYALLKNACQKNYAKHIKSQNDIVINGELENDLILQGMNKVPKFK